MASGISGAVRNSSGLSPRNTKVKQIEESKEQSEPQSPSLFGLKHQSSEKTAKTKEQSASPLPLLNKEEKQTLAMHVLRKQTSENNAEMLGKSLVSKLKVAMERDKKEFQGKKAPNVLAVLRSAEEAKFHSEIENLLNEIENAEHEV